MRWKPRLAIAIFAIGLPGFLLAQGTGNSPYSQVGIGDVIHPAFVPAAAMGNVGASNASGLFINNVNPALLARSRSTLFEVGANGQFKRLVAGNQSQVDGGGNLGYLAFAFPIMRRWTIGANLRPYSQVGFETVTTGDVPGGNATAQYTYTGTGGLSAVELSNGFTIAKGLYLGLKASYVFGNSTNESISQLTFSSDTSLGNQIAFVERTNYSGLVFTPGIAYRQQLNKKLFANVGAVYDIAADINATRLIGFQARTQDGGLYGNDYDTIASDVKSAVSLPSGYRVGISFDNPYRWTIAGDFSYQQWADYVDFNGTKPLTNSYTVAVGGEWIPDINSISSYWNRVTYRFGVNYSETPYRVDNESVNDIGINFGASFPISRGVSNLNLGFTLGQRGASTSSNTIKEQYFKLSVGFTLNGLYDGWFVRSKID